MGPVLRRILVCGAGAIGCWLTARLTARGGMDVHLLARPERGATLATEGLTLETLQEADPGGEGRTDHFKDRFQVHTDPLDAPREPDLLIVATRAYQTEEAVRQLAAAGVRPGIAMTLQNGLGNAEVLAEAFGADRVVAGTTSHGVTWVGASTVRHAGGGDTYVGPWVPEGEGQAAEVARLLTEVGITTEAVPDPRPALWAKVAVNAALNPPTAIHRIPNGALLDGGELEADLRAAAREVAAVATAEGAPLDPGTAESAALRVATRTAKNRSSMLQARDAGRPLETDAITGEVVRRAARHGLEVPVNRRHLDALRRLETNGGET